MKIIIGADHRGYELKCVLQQQISSCFAQIGALHEIVLIDIGTLGVELVDYPPIA